MENSAKTFEIKDKEITVITKFFTLLKTAQDNGGVWFSAGGGTANVAAGILSRGQNIGYEKTHKLLDLIGGEDWYIQNCDFNFNDFDDFDYADYRWRIETIAKAAVKNN